MYLGGYISTQNIRFRDEEFNLKPSNEIVSDSSQNLLSDKSDILDNNTNNNNAKDEIELKLKPNVNMFEYPSSLIEFSGYKLTIPTGSITLSNSISVILGENGTGKTTFINWMANTLGLTVSLKEQSTNLKKYMGPNKIYPTVLELFHYKIKSSYFNPTFQTDVIKQLEIEPILTRKLDELSGGELQRVFIVLCLGNQADIYLFDEPSANLDIEKRLKVTKVIKKFIINNNKSAFVIEHDIMMSVAFAQEFGSKIILVKQDSYEDGIKNCSVSEPLDFSQGINSFLKQMGITMRISGHNRPRINKFNSQLDQEQKRSGKYYGIN
jgi:ATP-binding cassette subfamily E protein 1